MKNGEYYSKHYLSDMIVLAKEKKKAWHGEPDLMKKGK